MIFTEAKMELRQWEHTIIEDDEHTTKDDVASVLGMKWNKRSDKLACVITPELTQQTTKRGITHITVKLVTKDRLE